MKRRTVLVGGGAVFSTVVAGCLEGGEDGEETPSATATVEHYFRALADGDRDEANRYAHPDGEFYLADNDDPLLAGADITVDET